MLSLVVRPVSWIFLWQYRCSHRCSCPQLSSTASMYQIRVGGCHCVQTADRFLVWLEILEGADGFNFSCITYL